MSEANVGLARHAYARWAEGDLEGTLEFCTPDFEFVPAIAAGVEGGSVKGGDAVRSFFAGLEETWETFRIEMDEFRDIGDRVMAIGRLTAKGRGSELELDQPMYAVVGFREGKIARMQSFLERDAAEAAAERAWSEAT